MTPYRIAVVDDLERDRAWLAEKPGNGWNTS